MALGWGGLLEQSRLSAGVPSEVLFLGSISDVRINPWAGI